eukprot:m.1386914 g.1386914  ORF g.1386914 m.1386914 type:complete len:80 (-) comp24978_c1_seq5:4897-5136(-)
MLTICVIWFYSVLELCDGPKCNISSLQLPDEVLPQESILGGGPAGGPPISVATSNNEAMSVSIPEAACLGADFSTTRSG